MATSLVASSCEADKVIQFLAKYCTHSKDINTNQPFIVEPWQEDFLREAYKPDPDEPDRRFYQRVFLCVPARNGKSSLAAGLTLYHLLFDPFASRPVVVCAAASGAQANIVFGEAETFVALNSVLKKKLYVTPSRGIIKFRLRQAGQLGEIKRLNAEADNLFGIDASAIVLDELHAAPDKMYDVLSSRIHSRKSPFFLSLSTAGGNKAGILGRIYDESHEFWHVIEDKTGFFAASDDDSRSLIWWYGASDSADITDPDTWTTCNPSSWMTESKLAEIYAASKSNESSFRKQHLNQWASGAGALLGTGVWQSLRNDAVLLEEGDRIIIGIDTAKNRDHTAVAVIGPEKDGLRPVSAKVFEPSANEYMPKQAAEEVRRLSKLYKIDAVLYDPFMFGSEADTLSSEGFKMVQMDQTGKKIAEATERFRTLCLESKLCHNGDPILASHTANCGLQDTQFGLGVKKLGAESYKMDAAVALIFAAFLVGAVKPTPFFYTV
jgi:phage terminase large subunit-like protein